MKIIFLNTWSARVLGPINEFIKEQSHDTDVFCFQEAHNAMEGVASSLLSGYREIKKDKHVDESDVFFQSIYVRNAIPLLSSGTIMENENGVGLGLYAQINFEGDDIYLCDFHGISKPGDKLDNPRRLRQSEMLIEFFKDKKGLKIIGGDFNLLPENKSVQMFRENGYEDLIKKYNVATTRNRLAWDMYPDKQYYSDYVFVSRGVKVKNFSVPAVEISDHLPLILEIE